MRWLLVERIITPPINCFKLFICAAGLQALALAAQTADAPEPQNPPTKKTESIPWNQMGTKAGADYHGDGLSVKPTEAGARLHCVFQRMDGEATPEGLWLTSTVTNQAGDRFRVMAVELGHQAATENQRSVAHRQRSSVLARRGTVVADGQTVRFARAGLVEEYSVSMDGMRQDFVVLEKPPGEGQLRVQLAVSGARVESTTYGAQLVLKKSGRKIAYSRLHATDANGKELPARIQVQQQSKIENQKSKIEMALAVVVNDSGAVYPVRIDPTFSDANWISMGAVYGVNGTAYTAVTDGSGNLYVGGDFTTAGGFVANYIAKWNGSSWSALGSGIGGANYPGPSVYALAVSGSDLYAGGSFTNAGGTAANCIAKWNGTTWSALGAGIAGGANTVVYALAVSGTNLYVGGDFTTAGGTAANYIGKWDGSSWSGLDSGMGGDDYPYVYAIALSGTDLYAGGYFTTAGGSGATNIAKWNGSSWSALGSGIGGQFQTDQTAVYALAASGGDLYAGGSFTIAGGRPATCVAKWDGSTWSALGAGMDNPVEALAVSGNDLYAGGLFDATEDAILLNYVGKWNGTNWTALGSGLNGKGVNGWVYGLVVSGGDLYAVGGFGTAGGSTANSIGKWNGNSWIGLGSGMNNTVSALAVSGTDIYAGGWFTAASGIAANHIAKWNGSTWTGLGLGMNGTVYALAVSGSDLYAGGQFTTAGGVEATNIAMWNGSSWSALGMSTGDPSYTYVYALAASGSDLYAGGHLSMDAGTPAENIAKWDGNSWSALGLGVDGLVEALAISGNDLYAAGSFGHADGNTAQNIAKWDGSSWSALGLGLDNNVYALVVTGSGLYAGGQFGQAGGTPANSIAKWDGSSWSALGSGISGSVNSLAVSGSNVYMGGNFTTAGGSGATNIAKWNGSSWSALGSGVNNGVNALAVVGSDLYAGGYFATAGGKVSPYLAQAYLVAPPGGIVDSIVTPSSGIADIKCYGNPGQQFGMQRATNLSSPLWTTLNSSPLIPAADGSFTFGDTNAPPRAAYYRAFQY